MANKRDAGWRDKLRALGACGEAIKWARGYPSLRAAWSACNRSDWLIWLLRASPNQPDETTTRLLAADCAEYALQFIKGDEFTHDTALACIQVARAFVHGEATAEEMASARAAVYAASASASASAAARAADAAADAAARAAERALADIVRRHFPRPPGI